MPPLRRDKKGDTPSTASGGTSIDALPDATLQHILGFLPARDAVRTCVLARRWRDLWMSTASLRIIAAADDGDSMQEIREVVDHLLLLRGGAPLETCEFRLEALADDFSHGDVLRVNLWFRHALRCQVRVLRLVMTKTFEKFGVHDLHLVSERLMELELAGLAIKGSFLNLSGCLALEQLKIDNCRLRLAKKITSESLKRLSITGCEFSQTFRTHIYAPSLVSLLLDDNSYNTPLIESMPSLVDACFRIVKENVDRCGNCDSGDCNICHGIIRNNCVLLQGLSKAKNMALIAESEAFIFKMDLNWCPIFSKLKTLFLSDYWCAAHNLDALTCILKHSPLLEMLTLELFSKGPDHKVEIKGSYNTMQRSAAISEHLKIVKVKCEVVDERVLKILKLLCTFNILVSVSSSGRK
ncbi:hypothetical protein ACP70R_003775 [Stipagrostis hirtigluma subsp. patula]